MHSVLSIIFGNGGVRDSRIIEKPRILNTHSISCHEQKLNKFITYITHRASAYCIGEQPLIFISVEDNVQAIGAKSLYFPPSS